MGKGINIDDVNTGRNDRGPKPGELVDILQYSIKYTTIRLFGEVFAYGGHWVQTKTRDGKKAQFYTPCTAFDPETGRRDTSKKCAWCDHEGPEVRFAVDYYSNGILRREQKAKPERLPKPTAEEVETGFKVKGTDTWTPVKAIRMSTSVIRGVKELKELNVHENAEGTSVAYSVSHPKFGMDVMIKKDENAAPANMYSVQRGENRPLTKEERQYLTWDLSNLVQYPKEEDAQKEYVKWATRMGLIKKKDEDDEEAPRKKSKSQRQADFDDEDEDEDSKPKKSKRSAALDDDDDDFEPPKSKGKAKKRAVPDDDDDDEGTGDVDLDDEDEDPPPKKAKSRRAPPPDDDDDDDVPPPKSRKRSPPPDDDDEDEPPPKKRRSPPPDDDDEDEPPPKKRRAPPPDEDEDDDPPPKAKKRRAPPPDDDDDDIDL